MTEGRKKPWRLNIGRSSVSGQIKGYYNDAAFLATMRGKPSPDWVRAYGHDNPGPMELWMVGEHEAYLCQNALWSSQLPLPFP